MLGEFFKPVYTDGYGRVISHNIVKKEVEKTEAQTTEATGSSGDIEEDKKRRQALIRSLIIRGAVSACFGFCT